MNPDQMQPADQPAPQPAPSQAPMTPIAQFECWYLPDGKYTIFNYRKSLVVMYPGWLVVYKADDHSETARFQLAPDLTMKRFFGFVRIARLNGQKYSIFKMSNYFMMSLPAYVGSTLSLMALVIFNNVLRLSGQDATVGSIMLQLVLLLGAFSTMFIGASKAKAIVEAAKRAAGIAS